MDLGVASGGVSAMAGITFSYDVTMGSTLTGFVRLNGHVSVLGIISVSLELDLTLSYQSMSNITTGTATMTISVSLCFFSISVPITVQKQFSGPTQDKPAQKFIAHGEHSVSPKVSYANTSNLTFFHQYDDSAWKAYCNAFAS